MLERLRDDEAATTPPAPWLSPRPADQAGTAPEREVPRALEDGGQSADTLSVAGAPVPSAPTAPPTPSPSRGDTLDAAALGNSAAFAYAASARALTQGAGWPEAIGPYRVTGILGEGGMGRVYAAEQTAPIRRRVAVKVIRTDVPAHVAARFAAERQALALMEHPGIARVLDAGTTEAGAPWVAMEYVDGVPITRWCDERRLGVAERVRLMAAVCHAVQHAHQKGIIHRDLKPSNVLVTEQAGAPLPKIIDFGIAKAMGDAHLTGETLATEAGMVVGTPAYMSPEQADGAMAAAGGADVDTRADVYALGVLLYELLTGTLPCDPAAVGIGGFLARLTARLIDVPPPSGRVAPTGTVPRGVGRDAAGEAARDERAARRGRDPGALARELRGDIDAVVLRAMAPERERRYATAIGLAVDLERWLRHEPVAARAPGAAYRFGKLVRRRPALVALVASALVSLVALTAVSTVQARRVARARALADVRRAQAEELIRFMVGDLRGRLEPIGKLDILDDVGTRALAYFAAVPATELSDEELLRRSEALDQLGQVRLAQGDAAGAMQAFREALAQARGLVARDATRPQWRYQLGQAEFWVGQVHYDAGALDSALGHFERYLDAARFVAARDRSRADWQLEEGYALSNLGSVHEAQGDLPRALADFRAVLDVKRHVVALAPRDVEARAAFGLSHNTLAVVHEKLGAYDSAHVHYAAALDVMRRLAAEHPGDALRHESLADAHYWFGNNAEERGDRARAAAHLDSACAIGRSLVARDAANATWARTTLACTVSRAAIATADGAPRVALVRLIEARDAVRVLTQRPDAHPDVPGLLARAAFEEASAHLALDDRAAARAAWQRGAALLATRAAAVRGSKARDALALAHHVEAELASTPAERRAAWAAALDALGPAETHELRRRTALRARVLEALGREAEAAPLRARLVTLPARPVVPRP